MYISRPSGLSLRIPLGLCVETTATSGGGSLGSSGRGSLGGGWMWKPGRESIGRQLERRPSQPDPIRGAALSCVACEDGGKLLPRDCPWLTVPTIQPGSALGFPFRVSESKGQDLLKAERAGPQGPASVGPKYRPGLCGWESPHPRPAFASRLGLCVCQAPQIQARDSCPHFTPQHLPFVVT